MATRRSHPVTTVHFMALGTRGDVQPFVCAAKKVLGLAGRKENAISIRIVMVVYAEFAEWARAEGKLVGNERVWEVRSIALNLRGRLAKASNGITSGDIQGAMEYMGNPADRTTMFREGWRHCQDADFIVTGMVFWEAAELIAEKLGVGVGLLATMPLHTSLRIPPVATVGRGRGGPSQFEMSQAALMELNDNVCDASNAYTAPLLREWRAILGLSPDESSDAKLMQSSQTPTLGIWSANLLPRPDDWPEHVQVGGAIYPELSDLPELPPSLAAFLERDPDHPPVFLGWGSMPVGASMRLLQLLIGLLQYAPRSMRFVVQVDPPPGLSLSKKTTITHHVAWNENDNAFSTGDKDSAFPSNISQEDAEALSAALDERTGGGRVNFVREACAHLHLFPQCAAIVTHCGAGTAAAALRAGRPIVPCPLAFDQPFWAAALARTGVAADPLPFHEATGRTLVRAIEQALEPKVVAAAREMAERVRAESGSECAAKWIIDLVMQQSDAARSHDHCIIA